MTEEYDAVLSDVPEPPDWITGSAADEWRRIVPDLVSRGLLETADLGSLEAYCVAMGQVRDLQAVLDKEGMVFYPKEGLPKRHPAAVMQAAAIATAMRLGVKLGLASNSRQKSSGRKHDQGGSGDLFAGMDY